MPYPFFHQRVQEHSPWVSIVSLTFMMISSVFPWTTASGLMMAKVQVFSDETVTSRGWGCQMLGSQRPSLRLSGGLLQGPHSLCKGSQGSPAWPLAVLLQTWTLVGPQVWLQTSASTSCKGHNPGREGVGDEGGGGEENKDYPGTETQKQLKK